jgi:DNA-binding transcriptional ArsR family regulator
MERGRGCVLANVDPQAAIQPVEPQELQGPLVHWLDRPYAFLYIYAPMHIDVFQTLADPTRRRIVETLRGSEQAVNDIVDTVNVHQSGVSRHLRILYEAGFVQVRPDGPKRLYSLRPEPFRELDLWVAGYRGLWEARLDSFADALDRKQKTRAATRKKGTS